MMSSGRIAQHRNYGELMARHEKEVKLKRIFRIFVYFLIIVFMILLFLIVRYVEYRKTEQKKPATPSAYVSPNINQSSEG